MARVMVVDDAGFMRHALRGILERHGHQVIGEAATGYEAVQVYQSVKPDVVTMDITMPDLDGVSAVQAILKVDPKARIIMCSAIGAQSRVLDAIQAGAKDYVIKPFEEDRVVSAINQALKA